MLKPDKFTDPKNCVVYNSYIILKYLIEHHKVSCQVIREELIKNIGEQADILFVPTMDFLYLLNLISFDPNQDKVELIYET